MKIKKMMKIPSIYIYTVLFANTKKDSRHEMHVACESYAWFIFNLESLLFTDHILQYLHAK